MATTPEGKVKARVKKVLQDLNAYYVMPATGGYGSSGAPDFIACLYGNFIGIECKSGKNQPTLLQLKHLSDIKSAGGKSIVVNEANLDQLRDWLSPSVK